MTQMQRIAVLLLFLICSLSAFLTNAQAQGEQEQQTLLPEIDPQDIEIRSQFQARFPGLRRQPILGFNPKPRVFQVDPDRRPFIESEEAVAASLPVIELDRPEPPSYQPLMYADPNNGFVRAGLGNYITPEADVYAIHGFGENNWVSGNLDYRSSDGHLDHQSSSFRRTDVSLNSQFHLSDRNLLRLNAGAFSNFNYLPADEVSGAPSNEAGARAEGTGYRFGGDFTFAKTSITGFDASFHVNQHNFDISESSGLTEAGESKEWSAGTQLSYSWAGPRINEIYSGYADINSGGIEMIGREMDGWNVIETGARYERLLDYETDIKAKMGTAFVNDAFEESTVYIVPEIDIRHTLFNGLDIRGRVAGGPDHRTLKEFRELNRFMGLTEPISHHYQAEALSEIILEPLSGTTFTGGVQYEHIRNYAYFTRQETSSPSETRYTYLPDFQNASFMKLYGAFSQQLAAEKFWVNAEGYWQRPRLSDDGKIPFVESIGLEGSAAVRPIPELVVEGWVDFTGSRFNPAGEDLSSYMLLGTRFEVSIGRNAGIYGKLLNITDQRYEIWQGYEERGFQAYLGITYLF